MEALASRSTGPHPAISAHKVGSSRRPTPLLLPNTLRPEQLSVTIMDDLDLFAGLEVEPPVPTFPTHLAPGAPPAPSLPVPHRTSPGTLHAGAPAPSADPGPTAAAAAAAAAVAAAPGPQQPHQSASAGTGGGLDDLFGDFVAPSTAGHPTFTPLAPSASLSTSTSAAPVPPAWADPFSLGPLAASPSAPLPAGAGAAAATTTTFASTFAAPPPPPPPAAAAPPSRLPTAPVGAPFLGPSGPFRGGSSISHAGRTLTGRHGGGGGGGVLTGGMEELVALAMQQPAAPLVQPGATHGPEPAAGPGSVAVGRLTSASPPSQLQVTSPAACAPGPFAEATPVTVTTRDALMAADGQAQLPAGGTAAAAGAAGGGTGVAGGGGEGGGQATALQVGPAGTTSVSAAHAAHAAGPSPATTPGATTDEPGRHEEEQQNAGGSEVSLYLQAELYIRCIWNWPWLRCKL